MLVGRAAIAGATSFDDALVAGLDALCDGRPDVLAHAVWTRGPGAPLHPLGVLHGAEAVEHAALGTALVLASPPGTELTREVLRQGRAVWIPVAPMLATAASLPCGVDLVAHGVQSGAGFPVMVRARPVAVVELLCLGRLERDEAAVATVITSLGVAAAQLWRSAPTTDGTARQSGRSPHGRT